MTRIDAAILRKKSKVGGNTNGVGRAGQLHAKEMKLKDQLTLYTKINSRWIKDLNISRNTVKVLEENTGRKLSDIPRSNILTDTNPQAGDIKERINKWDLFKIKSFCMAKENNIKIKREPTI